MLSVIEFFFADLVKSKVVLNANALAAVKRLQINTVRDLLFYCPVSYQVKIISPDLSFLQDGQLIQTEVTIKEILFPPKKHSPLKILVTNDTGSILLVFFNKPPPFIFNKLKIGSKHLISGKVQMFDFYFQISHPEFLWDNKVANPIEPIYPLTYGMTNKQLYSYILSIIKKFEEKYKEVEFKVNEHTKEYLKELLESLKIIHLYKSNINSSEIEKFQYKALRNLAQKELLAGQMALYNIRMQIQSRSGNSFTKAYEIQKLILKNLGFELTFDQQKVIEEIELDQQSSREMMRLLQGDVGSGKTLVALLTMINVVHPIGDFQSVLMAPTDLLANQHYQFFTKALKGTNFRVELLTGKILGKARKEILANLENGSVDILVGTHALFQEKVNFKKLGYIIIDEQHKFGVKQRLDLINKATHPDILVMTATPIPRSLTLTLFGDMAVSQLKNKPKNRLPITTSVISNSKIIKVLEALEKKLALKERIYWVCPLIRQDDPEATFFHLMDVQNRFNSVDKSYPNIAGILHGKMKNDEKEAVMQKFKNGEIQILVATTVIEVGIDVPEATLMIIENAEQFGLAQLHQIRGRVGRGTAPSHCILLYNPNRLSFIAKKRFEIMKSGNDGFYIAEQDLLLRGGGEILGVKQSGEGKFFFANLARDTDLLIEANKSASTESDIELTDFQIKLFERMGVDELN